MQKNREVLGAALANKRFRVCCRASLRSEESLQAKPARHKANHLWSSLRVSHWCSPPPVYPSLVSPWSLSVCVYLTRVRSCFFSLGVQLQEVLVSRRTAEPGFAKMNGAGQKVRVPPGMLAAVFWNINASAPALTSDSPPSKHPTLLTEQPTQSHRSRGVAISTR